MMSDNEKVLADEMSALKADIISVYNASGKRVSGEFEQFVSTLRKERRKADDAFIRETKHRFNELNMAIEQVKLAANLVLHSHDI